MRGGIALAKVNGPNQAKFVFVFGKYLSLLRHGQLSTLRAPSQMFVVSGSGPAIAKDATEADINVILAAISGQKVVKFAGKTGKGTEMAVSLRHPARWPLSRSAFRQGALLRRRHHVDPAERPDQGARAGRRPADDDAAADAPADQLP